MQNNYFYKSVVMLDMTPHDIAEGYIVCVHGELYEAVLVMFDDGILNLLSLVSLGTKELLNLDISTYGNEPIRVLSFDNDLFKPVTVKDFFTPNLREMLPIKISSPTVGGQINAYQAGVQIHRLWEDAAKASEQIEDLKHWQRLSEWMYSPHKKAVILGHDKEVVDTDFDSVKW